MGILGTSFSGGLIDDEKDRAAEGENVGLFLAGITKSYVKRGDKISNS